MLSRRDSKYINLLHQIALDIVNPVRTNARVASCIVYRGDVVAFGVNERKTHPFQAKFGRTNMSIYLHAETSAIKNALKEITLEELTKSSLYVTRIKSTPKHELVWGLSKPCPGCIRCIDTFGINKVVYTTDEGDIRRL